MPRIFTACLSATTVAIALSSCAASKPLPVASPAVQPSPIASTAPSPARSPNSQIGKTDQFGTLIKLDTPAHSECHRKYQSIKVDTFEKCLVLGMTYVQVANVFGGPGELQAESGNTQIWQWNDGAGKYATASFTDGYMVGRSQVGLEY